MKYDAKLKLLTLKPETCNLLPSSQENHNVVE